MAEICLGLLYKYWDFIPFSYEIFVFASTFGYNLDTYNVGFILNQYLNFLSNLINPHAI